MNFSAKNLVRILLSKGYVFKRSNGSHHLYNNKETGKTIIVPMQGNRSIPKGTFFAILKQADIDKMDM